MELQFDEAVSNARATSVMTTIDHAHIETTGQFGESYDGVFTLVSGDPSDRQVTIDPDGIGRTLTLPFSELGVVTVLPPRVLP